MNSMLDKRAQILLKTLIERYIAEGQPIGSRTLSKFSGLDLSPATIRNVMADLEELGLHREPAHLRRPRADARRLPLLRRHAAGGAGSSSRSDLHAIEGQLHPDNPQRVIHTASHLLSQLTAVRRRGDDAARRAVTFKPHRVPQAVGEAHPADRGHARWRRAEPHPLHRAGIPSVGADRGGELHQPELRRPELRGRARRGCRASCARCART